MHSISVIIPTLNEAPNVKQLLPYLKNIDQNIEIIVSDGNSSDNTIEEAKSLARVVRAPRCRGVQMNAGAGVAYGDILWFLHADCRPHPDSTTAVRQALADPRVVGGGFEYNFDHSLWIFRLPEITSNFKNRLLKLLFGDMGIFVRKDVFEKMGGYRELPLMEDMDFCKRLKKMGRIVILPQRVNTSARRWMEEGIWINVVRNTLLKMAWTIGVKPRILAKWYKFK